MYSEQRSEKRRLAVSTPDPIACRACRGAGGRVQQIGYDTPDGPDFREVEHECADCGGSGDAPCENCGEPATLLVREHAGRVATICGDCTTDTALRCVHCGEWTAVVGFIGGLRVALCDDFTGFARVAEEMAADADGDREASCVH